MLDRNRLLSSRGFLLASVVLFGCSVSNSGGRFRGDGGRGIGDGGNGNGSDSGVGSGGDASIDPGGGNCTTGSANLTGCQCSPGDSNPCYTGPAPTRNRGVCHDGTQTCVSGGEFGTYGSCMGESLPGAEAGHCSDQLDNDCDGLIDCGDPDCFADAACQRPDMAVPPDLAFNLPDFSTGGSCTAPDNNGRCPAGDYGDPFSGLCCPCTLDTCDGTNFQPACCVASICAGSASCSQCLNGGQLDPACQGRIDSDCDDFPEDCDQLCCPCKPVGQCLNCGPGQIDCSQAPYNLGCIDATSDPNHCGACDYVCDTTYQTCVSASCTP